MIDQDNKNYLEQLVPSNSLFWENNIAGYILSDLEQNILICNKSAQKYLKIDTDQIFKIPEIFKISLDYIDNLYDAKSRNILNKYPDAENHYKMINIIHKIVQIDKVPVQFVGFWPYNGEYKSLLFHCIPVFNNSAEVIALSYIISEYSMWGIQEYFDITERKYSNFLTVMPKDFKFEIKLSIRQHEVLFLLLSGISQRMSAQILGISYGTLSRVIREYICTKFGIEDGDITLLINKASKIGYAKYIPQSLCRPCIIVLNPELIVKYFSYNKPKSATNLGK